ncbi:CAP domain-containing protein [Bacillus sp. CGMCC 1.16607]|uniref:CAP domain-containing protein n=1 Tax=Bacillus sp. CGMCC 1.16607 TaxID=3351842 RepID=UPI0036432C8B
MAIFLTVGFYANFNQDNKDEGLIQNEKPTSEVDDTLSKTPNGNTNYSSQERPKEGISTLIGKDLKTLEKTLGKPIRIDPSYYGYQWYIYNTDYNQYLQVGIENNKVVTIYAIGKDLNVAPFKIGQSIEEVFSTVFIETNINIDLNDSSYRFELNDTDVNMRPLIQLGNIFAEIYFDKFTGSLSSIRFLDSLTLIKQRPYELVYRGELIEPKPIEDFEWEKIEKATEQQIFDLTNILRLRHHLNAVEWDEKTSEVAYGHSKDMFTTNTFSHTSKEFGELSDRLKTADVFYKLAGENIAANYIDGPAVVEGWLNSKGHRETLLNNEFTHLGVGVYHKYYTQNFIQRWEE